MTKYNVLDTHNKNKMIMEDVDSKTFMNYFGRTTHPGTYAAENKLYMGRYRVLLSDSGTDDSDRVTKALCEEWRRVCAKLRGEDKSVVPKKKPPVIDFEPKYPIKSWQYAWCKNWENARRDLRAKCGKPLAA